MSSLRFHSEVASDSSVPLAPVQAFHAQLLITRCVSKHG